ncbi:MAG: alpha/beta hydrolase-fold protein [Gemmatimonadota bacterium]|nr:alpha/beta hydrolase-fold protein [Gemmatimonadota bacterium]
MRLPWTGAAGVSLLLLATSGIPSPVRAQFTISLRDSVSRRLPPHRTENVLAVLRDGDYARMAVAHSIGLAVNVTRPNGTMVRPFITPTVKGPSSVAFVAEGTGQYAVVVTNEGDVEAQYTIAFKELVSLDERTGPLPWRDEAPSPRIEVIRKQIQDGNTNTSSFWADVAKEGTPIVEPYDEHYDLVTFLWRAEGDTRNVYVRGSFAVPEWPKDALHRIGTSDIWYLTLRLPKGARFRYSLEPNRPADPDMPRVTRQMDPFDRGVRMSCPPGASKYRCESVAELPGAPPEKWMVKRPGVAEGRIERQKIHSAWQKVDRDVTIYLPAGYSPKGKPNALVVLFDGDDYLDPEWSGLPMWDNLIAAGDIPPTVVVMVDNLPGRRIYDLVANATFGDFMAKELVSWVRSHYNVTRDARQTVIGGASAGGLGAAYLGLAHPEVFGNALSMSGAFWWSPEHNNGICAGVCATPDGKVAYANEDATTEPNWVAQVALQQPVSPAHRARFYLAAGTFEFDKFGTSSGILEGTRQLRDILRAKQYDVVYRQLTGGHDTLIWRDALAEGLQKLLGAR